MSRNASLPYAYATSGGHDVLLADYVRQPV